MATLTRVHGTIVTPSAQYGYSPLFVKVAVAATSFNLATGIDGTFEKAVKAVETLANVIVIGTPVTGTSGSFFMMVDANTADFSTPTSSIDYDTPSSANDKLIAAVNAAVGGTVTVTTGTDLGGSGTITLA